MHHGKHNWWMEVEIPYSRRGRVSSADVQTSSRLCREASEQVRVETGRHPKTQAIPSTIHQLTDTTPCTIDAEIQGVCPLRQAK